MKLEVLVATVNADVKKLIKDMNIQSDAIISNQCDKNSYEEINYNNHIIKVFNFNERGVGLNRNNALMRASADIVLFADDDEVFVDNYEKIVLNEFQNCQKADMLIFNISSANSNSVRKGYQIKREHKINKFNCLKFGAVRLATRLSEVRKHNIHFSLLFGGGALYGSGEDSIFIYDCLKKHMQVYTSTKQIAKIDFSESSWFQGYNDKYFYDKGALFYSLYGKLSYVFMIIFILRHQKQGQELSFIHKFNCMRKGYLSIKNL